MSLEYVGSGKQRHPTRYGKEFDSGIDYEGRNLWMSFLVVEKLDESDKYMLGRNFITNFEVTIDINSATFRDCDPERKCAVKPVNLTTSNERKAPVFLNSMVELLQKKEKTDKERDKN